jgi:hypothetical protein
MSHAQPHKGEHGDYVNASSVGTERSCRREGQGPLALPSYCQLDLGDAATPHLANKPCKAAWSPLRVVRFWRWAGEGFALRTLCGALRRL